MAKVALVTGSSRGIGRECAVSLARAGFSVAVNYIKNVAEAEKTLLMLRQCGVQAAGYRCDVSCTEEVALMAERIKAEMGEVSVLVNNAGVSEQKLLCDITDSDWRNMLSVNLDSAFYCARAFLPDMINKKYGRIINISSIWGIVGASCEVHYSTAKAGLIGFTKALAKEVAPSGITVNCVAPGVIKTDMCAPLGEETLRALAEDTPVMRLGTPEDVAAAVLFFAGENAAFITGQVLSPNGGLVV